MFIPIGDTPNQQGFTPWMNWLLIAANVAVYVLITLPLSLKGVDLNDPQVQEFIRQITPSLPPTVSLHDFLSRVTAYDLFTFAHGYKPGAPETRDLFFSMFLHGGFLHLFGNMLFLWIYGDNIEYRLGRLGHLFAYLATGAAATLFFSLFSGPSMTPLVGASGAISGILGLYFILFPRNKIKVFVVLFPFFVDVVLLPARWVLGFFILIDNMLPFLVGAQSGVAYGAHIGGFLAGLLIAWTGERVSWHWPWKDSYWRMGVAPAKKKPPEHAPETPLREIRAALADGVPGRAVEAIGRLDRSEVARLGPDECVTLAGWLDDAGHPIAATRLLRGCLGRHAQAENLADVYLTLGLMRLKQGQSTSAYQYLLSVFDYHPSPETEQRAREALSQINIHRSAKKGDAPG